jgi:hypothetical protein
MAERFSGRFASLSMTPGRTSGKADGSRCDTKLDVVKDRVTSPLEREDVGSIPTWSTWRASSSMDRAPNVPWPMVPVQQSYKTRTLIRRKRFANGDEQSSKTVGFEFG